MIERMSHEEFTSRVDAGEDVYAVVADDLIRRGYIFNGQRYVSPNEQELTKLRTRIAELEDDGA